MLREELMHKSGSKVIKLYIMKTSRKSLKMFLQEYDVDPDEPSIMSFTMFQSWNPTIANIPCARATEKAVQTFYNNYIETAKQMVKARVEVLTGEAA